MTSYLYPGAGNGVPIYSTASALPATSTTGSLAVTADTGTLYEWNGSAWVIIASSSTGAAITALTGGVTATGPGSAAATVVSVGGSTAALVHSAELAANAATNANTVSTIVKRDSSGNFSAGTITATLSGTSTNFSGSLVGDVTGTQGATAIADATVTAKLITGFVSGSGSVSASDSILSAINKLDGNIAGKQASGSYITALTGDATASGPGSAALTLASIVSASTNTKITYNAKGLVTAGAAATLASADFVNQGTTTTVLHGNAAGNPSFGAVSLTADVTGTLPVANGGFSTSSFDLLNLGLAVTASAGTMTVALKQADGSTDPASGSSAVKLNFGTAGGVYNARSVTGALSLSLAGASTLGAASAVAVTVYVYAFDNAGTITLGASLLPVDEGSLQSSSTTATSNSVIFQASALSSKPIRLIGRFVATNTSSSWGAPTEVSIVPFNKKNELSIYYTNNAGTAITANVTNIDFGTKVRDQFNAWSGTVFTAPSAGLYQITGSMRTTASLDFQILSYVNSTISRNMGGANGLADVIKEFAGSERLSSGDTLSIRVDGSPTLSNTSGSTYHWISIVKVGD